MAFHDLVRVVFFTTVASSFPGLEPKRGYYNPHGDMCNRLGVNPFFETDIVIAKPWRVYYAWNTNLEDKCVDMGFMNVTRPIVNRIFHDMVDYLEAQPYWEAATLLGWMGHAHHEVLLFADQGPAGRFVGVSNVVRDANIAPVKHSVPLYVIQMKILEKGKFLVISDCSIGASILCARKDPSLLREEIEKVALSLELGEGISVCTSDFKQFVGRVDFDGTAACCS